MCFLFLLTLFFFISNKRCVVLSSVLNLFETTPPTPNKLAQEQNRGLFFLIAKIVTSGNESVKMCLHKIAEARSVLNEMHYSSKNPVIVQTRRSSDFPNDHGPQILPIKS